MVRIKYKEAVGLKVKRRRPSINKKPSKAELRRIYVRESKSIREVAEILGCSKDVVYRSLKEYRIARRPNACRSKLRKFKRITLEKGIQEKGLRGFAAELGVHENTLRHYLNVSKEME
jgi:DNA invertase Pin-like site-specific DNA recombinase